MNKKAVSTRTKSLHKPIYSQHAKNGKFKVATSSTTREEKNLTNFYHLKRRTVNNDSFESPTKVPMKKNRKSSESLAEVTDLQLPIGWKTENKSIDCQLKIQCKLESGEPQDHSLSSIKKSELKTDQMLIEILDGLRFGNDSSTKDDDKDSGNEDGKEMGNEFDGMYTFVDASTLTTWNELS